MMRNNNMYTHAGIYVFYITKKSYYTCCILYMSRTVIWNVVNII